MFPEIPENLAVLSATDLRSLATAIREALTELGEASDSTPEQWATATEMIAVRKEALAIARSKEAALGLDADDEAAPEPDLGTDDDTDDEDESDESDLGDSSDTDDTDDTDDESDESDETDLSGRPAPKVRTNTGLATQEDDDGNGAITPDRLYAVGGVSSMSAGEPFGSWRDLAETMMEIGRDINPGSNQKFAVANVPGTFADDAILGENFVTNLRKFEPDVMAALCAPTINTYGLACTNTDRRPVRGSLAQFKPDNRGSVSIFPSPSLADIVDQDPLGVGIWTSDDDDSLAGTDPSSKGCAVISCGTPTVYQMYGVWKCLTIQNLLAMTFPELVEAWLNRLAAYHSRVAELQLLEAMGTAATAVSSADLGYGTAVSITSSILTALTLHQEVERWDNGENEVWLPRWVQSAMKLDIMRRRNTSGSVDVPSDSRIDQMFRDVGVEPHYFIDSPTWAATIPGVVSGGDLNALPDTADMVIAPRGKFAVLDRGNLQIGVTGNNIYRDNASNASNNFTMFMENFEGLVDTDSCPAYLLSVEGLCHSGRQIDDVAIDCDGVLEVVGT